MFLKKTTGFVLSAYPLQTFKGLLDIYIPKTTASKLWKHWKAQLDLKTCADCIAHHGTVYQVDEFVPMNPHFTNAVVA